MNGTSATPLHALGIIANWPITDPTNMDAINMAAVARASLNSGVRALPWKELREVWDRLGAEEKGISWEQFTTGMRMSNTVLVQGEK